MAQVAQVGSLLAALSAATEGKQHLSTWIDGDALAVGTYPLPDAHFDFGSETLSAFSKTPGPAIALDGVVGRRTADVVLTLLGRQHRFASGKAALVGSLNLIEQVAPGTLLALEAHKPRTKRVVARKPEGLYDDPDQVRKFSAELRPGWFVATNNSTAEVKRYIRKAAELASLKWGSDIAIIWLP